MGFDPETIRETFRLAVEYALASAKFVVFLAIGLIVFFEVGWPLLCAILQMRGSGRGSRG